MSLAIMLSSIGLLLKCSNAFAKCAWFDPKQILEGATIVVHGSVLRSNFDGTNKSIVRIGKRHYFEVDVLAVLKGGVKQQKLFFDYPFFKSAPPVKVFAKGDEYLFAVKRIGYQAG